MLLEACVEDLAAALAAQNAGYERIEYCLDLSVGGVTPPDAELKVLCELYERTGIQTMIRPRGGSFVYTAEEVEQMRGDIQRIAQFPTNPGVELGFVVGPLKEENGELVIDTDALTMLREAAGARPLAVHRAFDACPDWRRAMADIEACGVDIVLTTGKTAGPVEDGYGYSKKGLLALVQAAQSVAILGSGGVRPETYDTELAAGGLQQMHLRAPVAGEEWQPVELPAEQAAALVEAAAKYGADARPVSTEGDPVCFESGTVPETLVKMRQIVDAG